MIRLIRLGLYGALAALAAALIGAAPPARANDSSAELSLGGLSFTKNNDVSLEWEELSISPTEVLVKYRFLNQSQVPVNLTVGFPIPDIDLGDPDANYAFPADDPVNFVGYQTKADGRPLVFNVDQRAFLEKQDVTQAVKAAGFAVLPIGRSADKVKELAEPVRQKLIDQGLLIPAGSDEKGQKTYQPGWVVKTTFVRQQTFPPGKPVLVEHRYKTSVGTSFDSVLRKALREDRAMRQEVQRYRTDYCVNDEFFKGVDRLAGAGEANTAKLREYRIAYVLKTGANWAGPIKDFRLVVDSGRADRLLALCGTGLRKLSPTAVEWTAKDFVPDRDLKILILSKGN